MSIRPATAADYPTFARLFPELQTGDTTPSRRTWEAELVPHALMLEHDGVVAGYLYFQVLDGLGYVRHVITDPAHRGQGVGRTLMQEVARRLRGAGIERWCLNVKPDNEPAVRLYERMGMRVQHASVAMRMGWDIIERLPAPAPDVAVAPLVPAEDPEVERALALPPGLLAPQHTRAGAYPWLARQGGEPVGLAVFIPDFPGAYPFRARTPAVARALLVTMQPQADPAHDFVQLVFEDAADLAAAFDAAGATRHLEFVHFAGPVPGSYPGGTHTLGPPSPT